MSCFVSIMMIALLGAEPGLASQRLYTGVNRPVIVTVAAPEDSVGLSLALMDVHGRLVENPVVVMPGTFDLATAFPVIWEIRQTAYVQLMDGDVPVGSALVLQPMLTRLPPRTEQAVRPDGVTVYTRIAGWGKAPPEIASEQSDPQSPEAKPGANSLAGEATQTPPVQAQVFTGLRMYPERDVILHTSKGDIRFAMRPDEAPNTAWNFVQLAAGGFYDGVIFHRVVPLDRDGRPFVIQAGDPTGTGEGDAGYWLPIEPSALPHDYGVISMARDDHPDSAGSQFFIALSREGTARLDGQYCAFGYAVEGARTIDEIASVELADVARGRPVDPPVIERAEVVPAPPRTPGRGRPDAPVAREAPGPRSPEEFPEYVPR